MPRLWELRTLCLIVEQKSFSRAAEILNLTQPAVSLQIKSLEAEYGTRLLHRAGPEIVPTENGQVVYELACQIVDLCERSKQQVRDLDGRVEGKLVLGASTGPVEHLLPRLLGRFKKRHPDVSISPRVGDSREIIDQVVRQRLELGFVGTRRRDQNLVSTGIYGGILFLSERNKLPMLMNFVKRYYLPPPACRNRPNWA